LAIVGSKDFYLGQDNGEMEGRKESVIATFPMIVDVPAVVGKR
jgi:hypothetical protein